MKIKTRLILLILLVFTTSSYTFSQSAKVPPFQMVLHTGKLFRAQNLPLGKPIIIVYFSPECEECHKFLEEMLEKYDDFVSASIAMITYVPVEKVKPYVSENNLDKYPNIYIGTEGNSLFVANYYRIRNFPFVALFDKNGNLIKRYLSTEVNVNDLILHLKNL